MVSDDNFFLFSPLLHEVAMGRIESRHVAYPIRRLHWRDRFNFIQASVNNIDIIQKKVDTSAGMLTYDYLVLALGGVADMSGLENIEEKPNVFTLKTLYDSRLIRNHIIMMFERASVETSNNQQQQLLSFVVSGAGYIGVQLVTELRDFIFRSLIKYYRSINTSNIRILLIEKEDKIISNLHPKLGAYAMKQLKRMGIEVIFRSRLTRVWEDRVQINNEEIIPTKTVIWLSGAVANPRIAEINAAKDNIGRIMVNDYLEVPDFSGVYALGDCAHFKQKKSGEPIPRRAHIAVRQASVVARNILAEIRGLDKKLYVYSPPPELVSLGTSQAMFRFRGLRVYGLAARFIWLGAYTLLVTGSYNRVRIVIDWVSALIFGRDTSYIKTKIGKSNP
jgi:NADH dehydrogenase